MPGSDSARFGCTAPASASHPSRSSSVEASDSGGGTSGIGAACSKPGSGLWNDAIIEKMMRPCWTACTRRVQKLRPSRIRSTWYRMGAPPSPGSRKYPWSEWGTGPSTVRSAATSAWPTT